MKSNATLTSLAMLKVKIDQSQDYLDYLNPFVLQVLIDRTSPEFTIINVKEEILEQFGLVIPERSIGIVLKRLARSGLIKRTEGYYRIIKDLPDPEIVTKKVEAERHINAVASGLIDFSRDNATPIEHVEYAVEAISTFLSRFDISCLRAYLRGTAIPEPSRDDSTDVVLVSEYVVHLQRNNPERFRSFMIMVEGHMLANALLCPDLQNTLSNRQYRNTTLYLDTPLLVWRLGIEGEAKEATISELISLLQQWGGKIGAFSHSREELETVIRGAADNIDSRNGRGAIVMHARQQGITKSDMLLLAGQINDKLARAKIEIEQTPKYLDRFQIDETEFEQILGDEIAYYNPHAIKYDINSVRSIYALRRNGRPSSLEDCKALLITNNSAFARAAWNYGRQHEASKEISSVITAFSLANILWLKAPMAAPALPRVEIISFAHAALQPSTAFLNKFLTEIDKLEKRGSINERDHQLLRSEYQVDRYLMEGTLGDENRLTDQTIKEVLERIHGDIKREESNKTIVEREARQNLQNELETYIQNQEKTRQLLYQMCRRKTKRRMNFITSAICIFILLGFFYGIDLQSRNLFISLPLLLGALFLTLFELANLLFGYSVANIHRKLSSYLMNRFLKRTAEQTGIDLDRTSPRQ